MSIFSVDDQARSRCTDRHAGTSDLCHALPFNSARVRQRAIAFIDQNLFLTQLRPSFIAEGVGVSRAVLYRSFQIDGGVASFLHERRLVKARLMLEVRAGEPGIVQKVASAHGYASAIRFSRLFASRFAELPTQFVRKVRASARVPGPADEDASRGRCVVALGEH